MTREEQARATDEWLKLEEKKMFELATPPGWEEEIPENDWDEVNDGTNIPQSVIDADYVRRAEARSKNASPRS